MKKPEATPNKMLRRRLMALYDRITEINKGDWAVINFKEKEYFRKYSMTEE
jgi:hypothetical protein